ncbi:WYL domain-containing protein [Arthrobacter roseus]|uniref:WYL domain-containing protein n=1 Tax=Arthrobacter roseus TaxID=136274 RepID=UPI0019623AA0|nr:putative DNA-binding transcriptional regulator YafY [Arthrobacter roseus]
MALLAGLSSSAAMSMQPSSVDRELLAQKLSRLLPARHKAAVDDINNYVASYQSAIPTTSARTIRDLAKYCRLRLQVKITESAHGHTQPAQILEPHQVIQNDYLWYLVAWNQDAGEWQTLRIDRIGTYSPTTRHFVPRQPPGIDMAQYTANSIATAPYAYRVEAVFKAPASDVAQRFPIDAVYVEPLDEHSCVVHTGADTYETVAVYLLAADIPFFIRSPEAMRLKMKESGHRLLEAAIINPADAIDAP